MLPRDHDIINLRGHLSIFQIDIVENIHVHSAVFQFKCNIFLSKYSIICYFFFTGFTYIALQVLYAQETGFVNNFLKKGIVDKSKIEKEYKKDGRKKKDLQV